MSPVALPVHLPPGLLSVHALPSDHHDGPWDHILVPPGTKERLLNQTLTAEALTKQYLEVLHDLRTSSNLVLIVPTEGGMPVLDIGELRRNLQRGQ